MAFPYKPRRLKSEPNPEKYSGKSYVPPRKQLSEAETTDVVDAATAAFL